eukprot:s107_g44.t1
MAEFGQQSLQDLLRPLTQVDTLIVRFRDMQNHLLLHADLLDQFHPQASQSLRDTAQALQVTINYFENEKWMAILAFRSTLQNHLRDASEEEEEVFEPASPLALEGSNEDETQQSETQPTSGEDNGGDKGENKGEDKANKEDETQQSQTQQPSGEDNGQDNGPDTANEGNSEDETEQSQIKPPSGEDNGEDNTDEADTGPLPKVEESPTFDMAGKAGYASCRCRRACPTDDAKFLPALLTSGDKEKWGINLGLMATCHASASQPKAVAKVIPEAKGKLIGMALRVPSIDVADLTELGKEETNYEEICAEMKKRDMWQLPKKAFFNRNDECLYYHVKYC